VKTKMQTTKQRQRNDEAFKNETRRRLAPIPSTTTLDSELELANAIPTTIPTEYSFPVITLESKPNLPDDYLPNEFFEGKAKRLSVRENRSIRRQVYETTHKDYGDVIVKELRVNTQTKKGNERQETIGNRVDKTRKKDDVLLQVLEDTENIAQIPETLAVIRQGLRTYIVQEKIQHPTLLDYVEKNGALSPEETVRFLASAALPISKLHAKGTIHRDISYTNLFVNPEALKNPDAALEQVAYVGDMDDAVINDEYENNSFATTCMGTPGFASIEVATANTEKYGNWSDNTSLAVVAAYLLTGQRHINRLVGSFQLREGVLANVPDEIVDVLKRNINLNQKERHESVLEMVLDMGGEFEEKSEVISNQNTKVRKTNGEILSYYDDDGTIQRQKIPKEAQEFIDDVLEDKVEQHVIPDFYEGLSPDQIEKIKNLIGTGAQTLISKLAFGDYSSNTQFNQFWGHYEDPVLKVLVENPYDITNPKIVKKLNPSFLKVSNDPNEQWAISLREYLENKGLTPENIETRNKHEKKLRKEFKKEFKRSKKEAERDSIKDLNEKLTTAEETLKKLEVERISIFDLYNPFLLEKEQTAYEKLPLTTSTVDYMKKHIGNYVEHLEKLKNNREQRRLGPLKPNPETGVIIRPTWKFVYNYNDQREFLADEGIDNFLGSLIAYPIAQGEYAYEKVKDILQKRKQRRLASPKNIETEVIEAELVDDVLTESERAVLARNDYKFEKSDIFTFGPGLSAIALAEIITRTNMDYSHLSTYLPTTITVMTGLLGYFGTKEIIKYKRQVLDKVDVQVKEHIRKTGERPTWKDIYRISNQIPGSGNKSIIKILKKSDELNLFTGRLNSNFIDCCKAGFFDWLIRFPSLLLYLTTEVPLVYTIAQARYLLEDQRKYERALPEPKSPGTIIAEKSNPQLMEELRQKAEDEIKEALEKTKPKGEAISSPFW